MTLIRLLMLLAIITSFGVAVVAFKDLTLYVPTEDTSDVIYTCPQRNLCW